jgi:hypothetical protein
MESLDLVYWIIGAAISGLIGFVIGRTRGRSTEGFWWGFFLSALGWLIVIVGPNLKKEKEEEERRAHQRKMQELQEQQLFELRALRELLTGRGQISGKGEKYWVKFENRDAGPIDESELLGLYSRGRIALDTEVALEDASGEKVYKMLSDLFPKLKED